ncbi:hypothetical protein FA15DRAFT_727514 [Coprinopsis marcescibilis]|uniref:Uncharacterized protein n=1 Tax=Coprinopsis marcescibilis TaxID=230819 RepID=A0A5C3KG97_COPMA|nr:hypothetical protein FA15DRAFT_727514 [Coprinopsis marcescibilis]
MAPVWTKEYINEYGLVAAKAVYANYVITMATVGIQLFMNCYALVVFFETPHERRQGRALYLISGWLIFAFYTIGACSDMAKIFTVLLEASNGREYLQIVSSATWTNLNMIAILLVFVLGDGLLIYRCYLILAGGWMWVLVLPVLMYLSVIVSAHQELTRSMPLAGKGLAVYKTATRILVESALPLAIAGILTTAVDLVPLTTSTGRITGYEGDPKSLYIVHACLQLIYHALQALAPQMIIFRVATGRSWAKTNKSSAEALSHSLAFNRDLQPEESQFSGRLTRNDEEIERIAGERRPDAEATANARFKQRL